ncbi:MAG: hypothetical protein AAGG07_06850 [Planctomycetota bacterium]
MNSSTARTLGVIALLAGATVASAQTPGVTYQGRLDEDTSAADGLYDLRFTMFDDAIGGATIAGPFTFDDVTVENGLFTVQLDLDPFHFDGTERFLLIEVRDGASTGGFEALSPRQPFGAAGQALYALDAPMPPLDPEPQLLSGLPIGTTLTVTMTDQIGNECSPRLNSPIRFANPTAGTGGGSGGSGQFRGDGVISLLQPIDPSQGWPMVYLNGAVPRVDLELLIENQARGFQVMFRIRDARPERVGYAIGDDGGAIEFVDLDLSLAFLQIDRQLGEDAGRSPTHGTELGFAPGNGVARPIVDGELQMDAIILNTADERSQDVANMVGGTGRVVRELTLVRTGVLNEAFDGVFDGRDFDFEVQLDPSGFVLQPEREGIPISITIRSSDDGLLVTEYEVFTDIGIGPVR